MYEDYTDEQHDQQKLIAKQAPQWLVRERLIAQRQHVLPPEESTPALQALELKVQEILELALAYHFRDILRDDKVEQDVTVMVGHVP